MSNGIFLIREDGHLVEMSQQLYATEDVLQELLASHPALLAGDQSDPSSPRKWLTLTREAPLAAEDGGAPRWSMDNVLLDQDAVPTIVEVKRSTDTRIRREVVGQMLDYAANAVVYLPIESLRAGFEAFCGNRGLDPSTVLAEFLGPEGDPEAFWQRAKTNLLAGRIRLVFVADEIPAELRRIVEFLNGQMDPAEVLAVEIRQYVGGGAKTLVPRVFGQTSEATQKKVAGGRPTRTWDYDSFFAKLEESRGATEAGIGRRLFGWLQEQGCAMTWGSGTGYGTCYAKVDTTAGQYRVLQMWTNGDVMLPFMYKTLGAFADDDTREELRRRLNELPGVKLPPRPKGPSFKLSVLASEDVYGRFLDILVWEIEGVRG